MGRTPNGNPVTRWASRPLVGRSRRAGLIARSGPHLRWFGRLHRPRPVDGSITPSAEQETNADPVGKRGWVIVGVSTEHVGVDVVSSLQFDTPTRELSRAAVAANVDRAHATAGGKRHGWQLYLFRCPGGAIPGWRKRPPDRPAIFSYLQEIGRREGLLVPDGSSTARRVCHYEKVPVRNRTSAMRSDRSQSPR